MRRLSLNGSDHWVKTFGVYLILILALLRFLIYPLHAAVKEQQAVFADQQETYVLKSRILEQARQAQQVRGSSNLDKVRSTLYTRETRVSEIQTDMLAMMSKYSEEKGLTVSGFEMPEAILDPRISEVPVVLKLTGSAGAFIELLKSIRENKKILAVKTMDISVSGEGMTFSVTVSAFRVEV